MAENGLRRGFLDKRLWYLQLMPRRRSFLANSETPDLDEARESPQHVDNDEETAIADTSEAEAGDQDAEALWAEEEPSGSGWSWMLPTVALLLVAGWTGFFGWTYRIEMARGAPPQQWVEWLSTWSIPAVLIVATWLLLRRNGPREANAFAEAARALADESASLEARLKTVNRELSLAREFIASQSLDLEALGRQASSRLNDSAEHLQSLIHDNASQLDTIGSISESAVANMEHLRDNLPVLSNAARDLSSQIGNAGNVAHAQMEGLVSEFDRLHQLNEAGEQQIAVIGNQVSATLTAFDSQIRALGEATQARFGKLRDISETFRSDMASIEDAALQSIQTRADELATALAARHAEQRQTEEAALASLQNRLEALALRGDSLISHLAEGREQTSAMWHDAINALEEQLNTVIARVVEVDEAAMGSARRRLAVLTEEAQQADSRIAESLAAFDEEMLRRRDESTAQQTEELAQLEDRLAHFDASVLAKRESFETVVSQLTDRSEELLARLDEIESHIATLNQAGDDAQNRLGVTADTFAERLGRSRELLEQNGARIAQLTDDGVRLLEIIRSGADHSNGTLTLAIQDAATRLASFGETANRIGEVIGLAEASSSRLEQHVERASASGHTSLEQLTALEAHIVEISEKAETLAHQTREELRAAIDALSHSADNALGELKRSQSELVVDIADRIAAESREKVAQAILSDATRAIAELDDAVEQSSARGQQTAKTLRDQMALLNELASNLEQRIAHARERAEERVDSDFSRRMALIMESLNSSAIDIAKAFDNEVADTQWANYLKGDRGIFTRRAVRLLDRGQARAVAEVYEEDSEFRETVNRFIHDFEAMLREVLATRDGNPMAVTLLSSDTGKLYVALAQAIERLRS